MLRLRFSTQRSVTATKCPRLVVLGASGSVGQQLLDLLTYEHLGVFEVAACVTRRRVQGLHRWKSKLPVDAFGITDETLGDIGVFQGLSPWLLGWSALESYCAQVEWDILVVACGGVEALGCVEYALKLGKTVWFANKEMWVCAGQRLRKLALKSGSTIVTLDSEHQALAHLMKGYGIVNLPLSAPLRQYGFNCIGLMASGGPFWNWSPESLKSVTPEMAVKHPVWSMGPKISVDSATWMNKGLEVIEACRLFCATPDEIRVIRHPQGWVHGILEDVEGRQTWLQAPPTLAYSLSAALWEARERWSGERMKALRPLAEPLRWEQLKEMELEEVPFSKVPALKLAVEVARQGRDGLACVFNAANEAAVQKFLRGEMQFTEIVKCTSQALELSYPEPSSGSEILELHQKVFLKTLNQR